VLALKGDIEHRASSLISVLAGEFPVERLGFIEGEIVGGDGFHHVSLAEYS
jgi:hypothetical protein